MPIRYEFGWYVHNFFLELQEVIKSVLIEKDGMWQRYLIRDATIDFCGAVRWRRILWDCELLQQFLFHSQRKHLFLNYLRGCRRLPISNLWKSGVKMQGLSPAPVIFLVLWNIKCDMFFNVFQTTWLLYLRWLFNSYHFYHTSTAPVWEKDTKWNAEKSRRPLPGLLGQPVTKNDFGLPEPPEGMDGTPTAFLRTCAKRTFSDIVFMLFGSSWAFLQRWVREFGMFNYAWPEHSAWHICYYSYYMLYINLLQQFDLGLYLISRIEPYDLDLI